MFVFVRAGHAQLPQNKRDQYRDTMRAMDSERVALREQMRKLEATHNALRNELAHTRGAPRTYAPERSSWAPAPRSA